MALIRRRNIILNGKLIAPFESQIQTFVNEKDFSDVLCAMFPVFLRTQITRHSSTFTRVHRNLHTFQPLLLVRQQYLLFWLSEFTILGGRMPSIDFFRRVSRIIVPY